MLEIDEDLKARESLGAFENIASYDEHEAFENLIAQSEVYDEKLEDDEFDIGELSDGYHTFNELYYHRTVLFGVIVNTYQGLAFKSKHHADGSMFDGMFIAGIKTPKGWYTYHCEMKYWDLLHCKVWNRAPKWDGHKPEDVSRLFSIVKPNRTYTAQNGLAATANIGLTSAKPVSNLVANINVDGEGLAKELSKRIKDEIYKDTFRLGSQ